MEKENCCVKKIEPKDEVRVMGTGFIFINIFQVIAVAILCGYSIHFLSENNIGSFLAIDVISLLISVVILCFIIAVVGWVSAVNNTGLGWIVFHCCMGVLLIIEIVLAITTADYNSIVKTVEETWDFSDDLLRQELQQDLRCCGYYNTSDRPALPCPSDSVSCMEKVRDLFSAIRWVASTSMFCCFIFGFFIDMAGCAMCVHPDTISLEEQQLNDEVDINKIDLEENFGNPFVI